ncbi:MAG: DUF433 domain-containing protein, partial [Pseudanabaena sp.]
MLLSHDNKPAITRTERGLTISGTRITLYQVIDSSHAGLARPVM